MTIWEATGWSLLRSAAVGLAVAIVASALLVRIRQNRWLQGLVVAPAILPGLWLGYAYRPEGLDWVITPWKADWLHAVICAGRVLPWALLVAWVVGTRPRGACELAWVQTHNRRSPWQHRRGQMSLWIDRSRGVLAASLIAILWTLTETEIAALLQARGWPEWAFRKLRGGWAADDLAVSLWPVIVLTCGLVGVAVRLVLSGEERVSAPQGSSQTSPRRVSRLIGLLAAGALFGVAVGLPCVRLVGEAVRGIDTVLAQRTAAGELANGLLAAFVASLMSFIAARFVAAKISNDASAGAMTKLLILIAVAAGGLGSLLLAVIAKAVTYNVVAWSDITQLVVQHIVLAGVLFPLALLLVFGVRPISCSRQALVDRQLTNHGDRSVRTAARKRWWRRAVAPIVSVWGLLFWLAFWDLQTAVMLAPPGWETSPGRLYNLIHYGQNETLAAMLLVLSVIAFAIPAGVLVLSHRLVVRR